MVSLHGKGPSLIQPRFALARGAALQWVKVIQQFPDSIRNLRFIGMRWIDIQIAMLGKHLHITLTNLDADNKKSRGIAVPASAARDQPPLYHA